jgi:hypothetical protein
MSGVRQNRGSLRARALPGALVLLLLMLSGNPAITLVGKEIATAVFAAVLIILAIHNGLRPDRPLVALCGLFLLIFLVQFLNLGSLPLISIIGFITMLFAAWATVRLTPHFASVYVRVMLALAVISLVLWVVGVVGLAERVLSMIGADPFATRESTGDRFFTVIIYTYMFPGSGGLLRNSGMFGEPGLFGGYLLLAVVLLAFYKDEFTTRMYGATLAVLTAALLSTQSTSAYLLLPLALIPHAPWGSRRRFHLLVVGICILLVCVVVMAPKIYGAYFLGPKISDHISMVQHRRQGWELTRFGSMVVDWGYVMERPFFGWGPLPETRFGSDVIVGMGNGLGDFLARNGFVGLAVFVLFSWTSVWKLTARNAVWACYLVLFVLSMLIGEPFLNYPALWTVLFLRREWVRGTLGGRTDRGVARGRRAAAPGGGARGGGQRWGV